MKTEKPNRQGDVILIPLDCQIEGPAMEHCVLALGEVTGHSHQIPEGAEKVAFDRIKHDKIHTSVYEKLKAEFGREFPGEIFPFAKEDIEIGCLIRVPERATLLHEEHKEIHLPAGNHAVVIQRSYSPRGWTRTID